MNTLNIFIHLKSLIYKKGLLFYLESWGYAPQSITKEALFGLSATSSEPKHILICEEDFFQTVSAYKKNFSALVLIKKQSELSKGKIEEKGICGVFDHTLPPAELQQAIRLLIQGGTYIQSGIFLPIDKKTAQIIPADFTRLAELTTREREVLRLITNELTNKEIAKLLFISPRTVETHRRNLIQKMKVKNSVGLVKAYLQSRSIA